MFGIKKVILGLLFAGAVALSTGLYAQDHSMQGTGSDSLNTESTQQSNEQNTETSGNEGTTNTGSLSSDMGSSSGTAITSDQIDQAFAGLEETPNDNIRSQHEGIAESQARDLQTKLGLEDDSYNEIKDAINSYLGEGWATRVELAQEAGDPDSYNDKSAELAYMRVDLAEAIKDELGETGETQWNSHAVDFWTALDKADFEVKAREAGIASGTASESPVNFNQNQNQLNQNQMDMENDQNMNDQNMNDQQNTDQSGENTEMNQENTEETESSTDQGTTEDQSTDQDQVTDEESPANPDQGE